MDKQSLILLLILLPMNGALTTVATAVVILKSNLNVLFVGDLNV